MKRYKLFCGKMNKNEKEKYSKFVDEISAEEERKEMKLLKEGNKTVYYGRCAFCDAIYSADYADALRATRFICEKLMIFSLRCECGEMTEFHSDKSPEGEQILYELKKMGEWENGRDEK
jgi:hypothetical protein